MACPIKQSGPENIDDVHRGLAGAYQGTLAAAAPGPNRYQLASLAGWEVPNPTIRIDGGQAHGRDPAKGSNS
jgi:hypothetical protein